MLPPTWLIYHPVREIHSILGGQVAYHDKFTSNQDPYIWNEKFLHTFCHATQITTREKGQINFWVSGNEYPKFTSLYCDLIFIIDTVHKWTFPNKINRKDQIIDNDLAFRHHYQWGNLKPKQSHYFKKKDRYTLKANSKKSFQPQDNNGCLIDIMPFLKKNGINASVLHNNMTLNKDGEKSKNSRPFLIDSKIGDALYRYLKDTATDKLTGPYLAGRHPKP